MNTTIAIDGQEFEVLLLESFRYCLGRMTYAVEDCVERLEKYWPKIHPRFQKQIQSDIRRAIESKQAGMLIDIAQWEKILKLRISIL